MTSPSGVPVRGITVNAMERTVESRGSGRAVVPTVYGMQPMEVNDATDASKAYPRIANHR